MEKQDWVKKLNEIILLLNDKNYHDLNINTIFNSKTNAIDFEADLICKRCNVEFALNLYEKSIIFYPELINNYNDIFYEFIIIMDDYSIKNCINITCDEFIIKNIIE